MVEPETNGERVVIDVTVDPDGFVAAAHVHPYQSERFEIVAGEAEFTLGKEIVMARPGDVVMVEPGILHHFRNAGQGELRFFTEVSPALSFETFLETMYGLAADGKTNRKGLPNPLRLASSCASTSTSCGSPSRRRGCRRQDSSSAPPFGRLLGYVPTYAPTSARPALAGGSD
jgi:mannose-6-phosphate isomerase-like protein (cupin superfamily)